MCTTYVNASEHNAGERNFAALESCKMLFLFVTRRWPFLVFYTNDPAEIGVPSQMPFSVIVINAKSSRFYKFYGTMERAISSTCWEIIFWWINVEYNSNISRPLWPDACIVTSLFFLSVVRCSVLCRF